MDGIGPEQLTIKELLARLQSGEVARWSWPPTPRWKPPPVARLLKPLGIKVTRLAYGIPVGGNLEYADEVTLYRALEGRSEI